jgi:hypothetical protein
LFNLDPAVGTSCKSQQFRTSLMKLAETQSVSLTHHALGNQRRSRITLETSRVHPVEDMQPGRQSSLNSRGHGRAGITDTADTILPLRATLSLRGVKIISSYTCVGIDVAIRGWLGVQAFQAQGERHVLDDICEISRVKSMAIVQSRPLCSADKVVTISPVSDELVFLLLSAHLLVW